MLILALTFALIIDAGTACSASSSGRLLRALRRADGDRRAHVGLPLRQGLRPDRRHLRLARRGTAELPRRAVDAVVDRQRLDVDVHGLQHDHLLRGVAGDPGRALRGGGGRRGERVPHGAPHQAAAPASGDPVVRDLLGDRLVPAVRRSRRSSPRSRRRSSRPTRRTCTSTTSRSPTSSSTTRPRCRSCSGSSCSSCRTS